MADRQIIYDTGNGKIVARESLTCTYGTLKKDRAVIIADIPDSVTHVTAQTIPAGQRKKVVRAKKNKGITTELVKALDDAKTLDELKVAIKALFIEELPSE